MANLSVFGGSMLWWMIFCGYMQSSSANGSTYYLQRKVDTCLITTNFPIQLLIVELHCCWQIQLILHKHSQCHRIQTKSQQLPPPARLWKKMLSQKFDDCWTVEFSVVYANLNFGHFSFWNFQLGPYITRVVSEKCEPWQSRWSVAREDLATGAVEQGDVLTRENMKMLHEGWDCVWVMRLFPGLWHCRKSLNLPTRKHHLICLQKLLLLLYGIGIFQWWYPQVIHFEWQQTGSNEFLGYHFGTPLHMSNSVSLSSLRFWITCFMYIPPNYPEALCALFALDLDGQILIIYICLLYLAWPSDPQCQHP